MRGNGGGGVGGGGGSCGGDRAYHPRSVRSISPSEPTKSIRIECRSRSVLYITVRQQCILQ